MPLEDNLRYRRIDPEDWRIRDMEDGAVLVYARVLGKPHFCPLGRFTLDPLDPTKSTLQQRHEELKTKIENIIQEYIAKVYPVLDAKNSQPSKN